MIKLCAGNQPEPCKYMVSQIFDKKYDLRFARISQKNNPGCRYHCIILDDVGTAPKQVCSLVHIPYPLRGGGLAEPIKLSVKCKQLIKNKIN